MKKWILMSLILGAMPLSLMAQDDDMYFVPSKQAVAEARAAYAASSGSYFPGSNRDVDEFNRQGSYYQVLPTDSSDIIDFAAVQGVYPDSTADYDITRRMMRYEGYEPNSSFWEGYNAGRRDSWYSWYSPFYSWYGGIYDPFYYPWYGSWYDPWYYGYYSPYYYRYGYYGWGYPYYGYYLSGGGGPAGPIYARSGNTGGTINRGGGTHGHFSGYRGSTASSAGGVSNGSSRSATARTRTVGNHRVYNRSGSTSSSTSYSNNSGNFSGSRSVSYSGGSSSSSSSGGGSFSGGGGGGVSHSSGGGGGGGVRSGGRR